MFSKSAGEKTGKTTSRPVDPLDLRAKLYLVCARAETNWVHNAREIPGHARFVADSPLEGSGFEPLVPLTPKRLNGSMPVSAMRK
jgi:hypothetical protein